MNLDKVIKNIGKDTASEMDTMDVFELKNKIYQANNAMQQVRDELEANDRYQALLQAKKDMEAGKREVDKRQKAIIQYALSILDSRTPL